MTVFVQLHHPIFFQLGEISEAEDALAEANILNNKNADVWAYLSLVCLKVICTPTSREFLIWKLYVIFLISFLLRSFNFPNTSCSVLVCLTS